MTKKMKNYIDGAWVDASAEGTIPVEDPATCDVLAECPDSNVNDVADAVAAAKEAFKEWRRTPILSRAQYMHHLKNLVEENFEDLSEMVVKENGKTKDEARGEVRRGIESIDFAMSVPTLMRSDGLEDISSGIDETTIRQPAGVFAAITPFNFPFMVPMWFLPTAITCGNTFILKPSPQTPLSSELLFEMLDEIDLPEGVVNLVHGGVPSAEAIMKHPDVMGVSFVGSSPVAKIIYETCTAHGKRVQAQGGAKNYIAVMPDASLEASVKNIMGAAYGCAGQRCLAAAVAVAVGDAYDGLVEELGRQAANLKVGYGLDETTQMGTVVSGAAKDRIEKMIQEGIDQGATVILDGRGIEVEGYENGSWVGPTILADVTPDMRIAQEEVFGPVLALMKADDFDDAVEIINKSHYGNAASIFTNNGKYAREFTYSVNAGNIGVNIGVAAPSASFPFGGQKDSFFGDLHGQGMDSIEFYTERKIVIERWI
ncbi:CoA-acylating methylmalonate-semialdehyde dehydrogenase [Phototrophicus methaneseepsis]|uniref:methylmalonate-semialdehyde dehydrogenase (CoA acylating) n=1 Tax=Phototrophicus methaneseepsis TaxID=2710758 RepID=A0A7S8EBB7_9CHLR|nr:CoA-acylating methylmalonate-semialdehyde dehydrogenase [Phototrophicus methaneseepsis]QPC83827.1 CoA-acylating methylmalonate-semialdehyde dehydrogenase [Phototrophicus methaneseepsis]